MAKKKKSTVNKAGNYTKPGLRKKIFNRIKSQASHGTASGQWSARKAQALAKALVAKDDPSSLMFMRLRIFQIRSVLAG